MQTLYLATHFNPVYWNTAYLIVNSGSIDEDATEQTDYTKLARAIGEIKNAGIHMSLVDINRSGFGFSPDAENNQILFGLKGLINVNNDLVKDIIDNRPYKSMLDFMNRVKTNKQAMIALIKGGAFDQFYKNRYEAMVEYIWVTCDKKKRITLQNLPGLIRNDLLPQDTEERILARRIYEFNRYLKAECKDASNPEFYRLDDRAVDFINELSNIVDGFSTIAMIRNMKIKTWDGFYQKWMDVFRDWIKSDTNGILDALNTKIFMADWKKYGKGNLSSWEMEALCFYYHDHELKSANKSKYGLVDFNSLPEEPVVKSLYRGHIPIFELSCICGTCVAKDKTKHTVFLLTTDGVVPVKFSGEHFSLFDRQVSRKNPDGTKTVVERSWFNRGNMVLVQGVRQGDQFRAKKYATSNIKHQLYHIDEVLPNGDLILRSERYDGDQEEEE